MRSLWRNLVRAYPFSRGRIRLLNMARVAISGVTIDSDRFGNRLLLDLDNHIDAMTFLQGSYELEGMAELARRAAVMGCDYFIDVGANIGVYTLYFAKQANIKRQFAFEPDPRNRAQLAANLWLNELQEKVEVFAYALSSEEGPATFYVNTLQRKKGQFAYNTSSSSLLKAGSPVHRPVNVETRRLDTILKFKGEKVAIKIDVEGAEAMVLAGARQFLVDNCCLIQVEIWDHPADALQKTTEYMNGLGYTRQEANVGDGNYLFTNAPPKASS